MPQSLRNLQKKSTLAVHWLAEGRRGLMPLLGLGFDHPYLLNIFPPFLGIPGNFIVIMAASKVETHETARALLDELEKLSPPLFVDLSSFWIKNILKSVSSFGDQLKKAHADLVDVCTEMIDSGKEFDSVWPNSRLSQAMQQRSQKREEYMRVMRLAIREDGKRPTNRLDLLSDAYESIYEFFHRMQPDDRTYSSGLTLLLRLEGLEGEMKELRRWRKQVSHLHAELVALNEDAMHAPDVTEFKVLEKCREEKSDQVSLGEKGSLLGRLHVL